VSTVAVRYKVVKFNPPVLDISVFSPFAKTIFTPYSLSVVTLALGNVYSIYLLPFKVYTWLVLVLGASQSEAVILILFKVVMVVFWIKTKEIIAD